LPLKINKILALQTAMHVKKSNEYVFSEINIWGILNVYVNTVFFSIKTAITAVSFSLKNVSPHSS
jgi:hypothetical protein